MDFKEQEMHIRFVCDEHDHTKTMIKLSFIFLKEQHHMLRDPDEEVEKTLRRLAKNLDKKEHPKKKTKKRATANDSAPEPVESMSLVQHGASINFSELLNKDLQTGMVINIHQLSFSVVVNPPTVASQSTFPHSIFSVGYPIIPIVDLEHANDFSCVWYRETTMKDFVEVSADKVFYPQSDSIGCRLKVAIIPIYTKADHSSTGRSSVYYLSGAVRNHARHAMPKVLSIREHFYSHKPAHSLRLATYNVLSEGYALRDHSIHVLYSYCKTEYLELEYRAQLIVRELLGMHADVIALQECDRKLFTHYLAPLLGLHGYVGHYVNKISMVSEGCAMFVHKASLHVVQFIDLPYKYTLQAPAHRIKGGYTEPNPIYEHFAKKLYAVRPDLEDIVGGKLGTVAQLAVVQSTTNPLDIFILANTHLFYHPLASYIRLMQAKTLLFHVERIKQEILQYADHHAIPLPADRLACYEERPSKLVKPSIFEEVIDQHFLVLEATAIKSLCPVAHTDHVENDYEVVEDEFAKLNVQDESQVVPNEGFVHVPRQRRTSKSVEVGVAIFGDFNTTPCSVTYEYLNSGEVLLHRLEKSWKELQSFYWGDNSVDNCGGASEEAEARIKAEYANASQDDQYSAEKLGPIHPRSFAYNCKLKDAANHLGFDKRFSNFVPAFKEMLDYIFIDQDKMTATEIAPLPSVADLEEETALPSSCFPSDHVSVVIDVEIH
eukprot:gene36357-44104_t